MKQTNRRTVFLVYTLSVVVITSTMFVALVALLLGSKFIVAHNDIKVFSIATGVFVPLASAAVLLYQSAKTTTVESIEYWWDEFLRVLGNMIMVWVAGWMILTLVYYSLTGFLPV